MNRLSRRDVLALCLPAAGLAACGPRLALAPGFPAIPWSYTAEELRLIRREAADFDLVVLGGPGAAVLRQYARPVPPGLDLGFIEQRMEATMRRAGGVGLAAPQVGLSLRAVMVLLDARSRRPRLIVARNPVIVARSDEMVEGYEGCLSIPGVGGLVRRHRSVRIEHTGPDGDIRRSEAEGFNAVVWQHEIDHLEGMLYTDRRLGELLPMDEVRRRRKAIEEQQAPRPANSPTAELLSEPRMLRL